MLHIFKFIFVIEVFVYDFDCSFQIICLNLSRCGRLSCTAESHTTTEYFATKSRKSYKVFITLSHKSLKSSLTDLLSNLSLALFGFLLLSKCERIQDLFIELHNKLVLLQLGILLSIEIPID